MNSFVPMHTGANGQRAVPKHPQRALSTPRSEPASAPPLFPAAEPLPPERDPSRILIKVVSRRAIQELVANFNRSTIHAE